MLQHLAIPSYIYPMGNSEWDVIASRGTPTTQIMIINPNSGPGTSIDPNYTKSTKLMQSKEVKVLGYVHTQYGNRDSSLVLREVDLFYKFYSVDGIFLDEIANTPDKLPYYRLIRNDILRHTDHSLTILNPGTQTCEEYMSVSDIICNFENDYVSYMLYQAPHWVGKYPAHRFWHIVHSTTTVNDMQKALSLSKKRNAGYVYITSEKMPNPYGKLPVYLTELLQSCKC